MPTESDDSAPTRAELERTAFGRAETAAEIAAAQDALRLLVEADATPATGTGPAEVPAVVPEPTIHEDEYEDQFPARRRRPLVPLLVVVGLFAGAVIGILVTRPETTASIGAATSETPTPAPTPDAAAALKSLLVPQTKADKGYPFLNRSGTGAIQPASVHRILTSSDGATLWTGRSDTDICLMWSRHEPTNGDLAGGVTCATPSEFEIAGLTLSEGNYGWTWNGVAFTTTLGD